jgi:phage I-like protein
MSLLKASTRAIKSGSSSDDSTYTSLENQIADLTAQRDTLASQIKTALDGAAFSGRSLNEQQAKRWIDAAQSLIDRAVLLAG